MLLMETEELSNRCKAYSGIERLLEKVKLRKFMDKDGMHGIYHSFNQIVSPEFLETFGEMICNQENLKPSKQYVLNNMLRLFSTQTLPGGKCPHRLINPLIDTYHAQLFIDESPLFKEGVSKNTDFSNVRRITFATSMKAASALAWSAQFLSYSKNLMEIIRRIVGRSILIGKHLLRKQKEEDGKAYLQDVLFTGRAYKKTAEFYGLEDIRREKLLERALVYYKTAFMQEDNGEEVHGKWYRDAGEICKMLACCKREGEMAEFYMERAEHYNNFSKELSNEYQVRSKKEDLKRVPKETLERLEDAFSPVTNKQGRDNSRFYSKNK